MLEEDCIYVYAFRANRMFVYSIIHLQPFVCSRKFDIIFVFFRCILIIVYDKKNDDMNMVDDNITGDKIICPIRINGPRYQLR